MKYLIIGSKGFIGQWAVKYYQDQQDIAVYGCDVVVDYEADNYFLIDASNASFEHIFRSHQFDACINCSGAASVPDSLKHPSRDYELNTHNVFKLLTAIKEHSPACKFVNLSSAAVYGNPESLPIAEAQRLAPVSPYGRHKLMAEMILSEFSDFYDIPTVSLRIFSAYGEGLTKQLFWDLHQKASGSAAISLWGTGRESRDFIHVYDLVRVIDLVIKQADFKGEAINAANGEEIYIEDAVGTYYSNFDEKVVHGFSGQGRKGDPSNWVADISTIRGYGYEQSISFEEGMARYYQWIVRRG